MNNYIENISDLIYLFIDGETDEIEQQALFKELANNYELQTEFKQAVLMSKNFMRDKAVLTPAATLKNSIFLKAGLSAAGGAVATSIVSTGSLGRVFDLFSKFSTQIFATLAGSLATVLVMLTLVNPLIYDNSDNSQVTKNIQNNKINQNDNNSLSNYNNEANNPLTLPSDVPVSRVNTSKIYQQKPNNAISNQGLLVINSPEEILTNESIDNKEIINTNQVLINESNIFNSKAFILNNSIGSNGLNNTLILSSYDPLVELIDLSNGKIVLDLKSISTLKFYGGNDISGYDETFINDAMLGVMYKADDHNSFGLQFGKEAFHIYRVENIDSTHNFIQENSVFWFAGMYRYEFNQLPIFSNINPYFDISLGATKYGLMSKGTAGLIFNLSNSAYCSLGLEGAMLSYNDRGKYNLAGKLGLIYSLGIRF
ncbi:MAG TPA: hypothetical protein PK762_13535 [Candidatus Kapabacteria bacterium]|nr:hypothetical protein [Candidatus Kapabacteria bacterium]